MKARAATIWFITCIVGARIAMGIFMSITGPTLPTLGFGSELEDFHFSKDSFQ